MKEMAEQVLAQRGWLARQPEPFRRLIFQECQLRQFERGAPVYHLGDPPGGIYGIVTGTVAVSIAPGEGGPYLAHVSTAGAWFGEGPLLTGKARRFEIQAVTPCVLMSLPLHVMERMVAEDPTAIRRFAQIAIANLDLALNVISDLMIAQPERRIAAALVRSAGPQHAPIVRVAQAELGRIANASRKLVNKALRQFGDSGWVETGYGAIKIHDVEALKRFAAGAQPPYPRHAP